MSIRLRLILLIVVAVLPAISAALWLVADTYDREQTSARQTLREATRALSLVLEREIGRREFVARLLAESDTLEGPGPLTSEALARFQRQARQAMMGLDGEVLLLPREGPPVVIYEDADRVSSSPLPLVFVSDAVVLLDLAPNAEGRWQAAVQAPVGRGAQARYNVVVTLNPSELHRILNEQKIPSEWIAAVLDRKGTIVARQPGHEQWVGKPAAEDVRARRLQSPEGFVNFMALDGQPLMASFVTSPVYQWTMVIGVPRALAGYYQTRNLVVLAAIGLALLIASIVAARWLGGRIAKPVLDLEDDALRLGRGETVQPRVTGIVELDAVSRSLTEAHKRIRDANTELEEKVALAVAEARQAQQQLSRSQRLEALGRLIGGVVHDFNNLLAIINNNVYVMLHMPAGQDKASHLSAIKRAVESGSRLTRQLLAFSRRQAIQPEVIDLPERLPEMLDLVHTSIGNSIELDVHVSPDTGAVEADPAELELALINLAVNARDAMPEGGTLKVEARRATPEEAPDRQKPYVLIAFTDTGVGVPAELHERVFEPFFTTKENGKGTGLGLSQVYGFCTQAGGTARLLSPPEGGTTVQLLLPVTTRTVAPAPTLALSEAGRKGDRVLLVEDNNELALATHNVLEAFGFQVFSARSADEALTVLEKNPKSVDVVVSDVVMAGDGNGFDLACELRVRRPDLPVILVTGYMSEMDRARAQGFEVLQKPCPPEVLAAAVSRARAGRERSLIEALQRGSGVGTDR